MMVGPTLDSMRHRGHRLQLQLLLNVAMVWLAGNIASLRAKFLVAVSVDCSAQIERFRLSVKSALAYPYCVSFRLEAEVA